MIDIKKKIKNESKTKIISFAIATVLIFAILSSGSMSRGIQHDIELNLKVPSSVVRQGTIHGKVEFIFKGEINETAVLKSIRVLHQDKILFEKTLSRELIGIGGLWDEYKKTLNEYEIAKRKGNRNQIQILREKLIDLKDKVIRGIDIQTILVDLNELFGNEFSIGNKKTIVIQTGYEYKGYRYTTSKEHTIRVKAPIPKPSLGLRETPEGIKPMPVPAGQG